ncbi:MAG: Ig-like domain repeat protein [Methanobacterium sp. ERen5]|nr:MAG: Ig-like domain repeat protein [Methanobacterium sp. ERen5]
MKNKKLIITIFLLLGLFLTFQTTAFVSAEYKGDPTHIDINDYKNAPDIYINIGQDTKIKAELWRYDSSILDCDLPHQIIHVKCQDLETGESFKLFDIETNIIGNAYINTGSNLRFGTYNVTFQYSGGNNDGNIRLPCENSVLLHVRYPTVLNVNNAYVGNSSHAYFTARLWDSYNNKTVVNRTVHFKYLSIKNLMFFKDPVDVGSSVTDSNGIATINYNVTDIDGGVIYATFDGDNTYGGSKNYGKLNNEPPNTHLNMDNITSFHAMPVNLTAKLTDKDGKPIPDKTINFKVNSIIVGSALTDSQGTATLNYNTLNSIGTYSLEADLTGCDGYDNVIASGTLTVQAIKTKLTLENVTSVPGAKVNLTAKLTDENGVPIVNKRITFEGRNMVTSALTDSNGVAKVPYTLNQTEYMHVYFYDDDNYGSKHERGLLKVDAQTKIIVNNAVGSPDKMTSLTAQLTDAKGQGIANKEIVFKINDIAIGSSVTNATGYATLPYENTQKGKHNIKAFFQGDNIYDPTINQAILSIQSLQPTTLTVNDVKSTQGAITNLTAKLTDPKTGNPLVNKTITFSILHFNPSWWGNPWYEEFQGTVVTDQNGIATLPYNITENKGHYIIRADFNGDDAYDSSHDESVLSVEGLQTILTVNNVKSIHGAITNLTAKLTTKNGKPLVNQRILFEIDNRVVGTSQTNSLGYAILPYNVTQIKGNYTIKAYYNLDEFVITDKDELNPYASSDGIGTLTVNGITPILELNNITAKTGKTVQLKAHLTDKNGNPLINKTITFKINNKVIGTVTTNSKGVAVLKYMVKLKKGSYKLTVQFPGDTVYNTILKTVTLKIS